MANYGVNIDSGVVLQVLRLDDISPEVPNGWILTTEHVSINWTWDGSNFAAPVIIPPTPTEIADALEAATEAAIHGHERDKAFAMVLADMWMRFPGNEGMTQQTALSQVRSRFKTNLETIRNN